VKGEEQERKKETGEASVIAPNASRRAVALYSGGLDSTLAILAVMKQGIEVKAVTFLNHFGCDITDKSSCSKNPFAAAQQFGFEVKLCHLSDKFINIVKNPKFGHGKNMNPCMDCRILMLNEAKVFMEMVNADFIITGEVIGQRPMSQRRDALDIIDRETGLRGHILRPLSAKLLKPTIPEQKGIVNRDLLYGFGGRTRKPQMALAAEFGLTDYPAPASGCLLTERNYSYRLSESLAYDKDPSPDDLNLLRVGRHFRLSDTCKVIIGRDEGENNAILAIVGEKGLFLRIEDHASPISVIRGEANDELVRIAASLCARYSDGKHLPELHVKIWNGENASSLTVRPADTTIIDHYKIERKDKSKVLQKV
jgi:tRNA-uridine 2-sulfurtransferase